jgi:hypothetical protein
VLCAAQDEFRYTATNVGVVAKVRTWHDDSGLGPAWHLSQVVNHSSSSGRTYVFPAGLWLLRTRDAPGGNAAELREGCGADGAAPTAALTVRVVTLDMRGAGTVRDVHVTVHGDAGHTGKRKLKTSANHSESCRADDFILEARTIDRPSHITLDFVPGGIGPRLALQPHRARVRRPCGRLQRRRRPSAVQRRGDAGVPVARVGEGAQHDGAPDRSGRRRGRLRRQGLVRGRGVQSGLLVYFEYTSNLPHCREYCAVD